MYTSAAESPCCTNRIRLTLGSVARCLSKREARALYLALKRLLGPGKRTKPA